MRIGEGFIVIDSTWPVLRTKAIAGFPFQWEEDDHGYTVIVIDVTVVYRTRLHGDGVPSSASASEEDNAAWLAEFETSYKNKTQQQIKGKSDSRQLPRIVIEKADTPKVTLFSHDWCDKCTWYEAAVRVVDEVATDAGDHLIYSLTHTHLIDIYHGRITSEDYLKDSSGNSYRVVVKVGGVAKTEQDPHTGTGGDYTIDYAAGTVTFLAEQTNEVKVTYHYATTSVFTIKPAPGRLLSMELVECQFSMDVEITDTVKFQAYGYVIAFAPQLAQSNGGPYPDQMLIPLGNPTVYKGMKDYINEAVRSYTEYPAVGGSGWRGVDFPVLIFDWDYARATAIRSSFGMEVRISLEHNTPFGGRMATATFYCASESET